MGKKFTIIVVLIILLGVFAFVDQKIKQNKPAPENNQTEETEDEFQLPLAIKHQYKDGKHVFVGDIELPNPCYNYNAQITDSDNPSVKNIEITYEPNGEEACTQVITTANYRVAYEGDEDLEFKAFVNGAETPLNIFEIPPQVDIEQFELFIKG
jgi:hypothetical protein